uniref:Polyprotein protein n=1 Tax=Solanum tuberosum TaxID=4113 RepID=M1DLR8_SOLTU
MRAARVEVVVSSMIDQVIAAALAPIQEDLRAQWEMIMAHEIALDALTIRVEGNVDAPEDPSADMLAILDISSATVTGDVVTSDDDRESDTPKTDKEELEACDNGSQPPEEIVAQTSRAGVEPDTDA